MTRSIILHLTLVLASGCGSATAPPPPPASVLSPAVQTYKLIGVVRQANPQTGQVTIRHEAIPGFMDAMTMPFTLKDPKLLEDVHPGDEVEGTLRVEKEAGEVKDYELTDLVVSRPAPAPALSLNLSGASPSLTSLPNQLAPGEQVPDFTMTDEDGKSLKLSDLRGKVIALTFIYTRCPLPDFCPRMDRKFSELAGRISAIPARAQSVRLISLSFDPEHDVPEVLKKHAQAQGASPPLWTFAVASHPELSKIARPLGLTYGPGRDEIIHNLSIALIDPDGRLIKLETGPAARSWDLNDILKALYARIPRP